MTHRRPFSPPRPYRLSSRAPRSRTEAAGLLVRIEFERARLERDLAQMEVRATGALRALGEADARARVLALGLLRSTGEEPG